ncbi:MAG: amidohydrolase family protein, partial [Polyangiaceae bacterium]
MFTRLRLGLVGAVIWFLASFAGCSCGSTDCGDGVVDEGETCDDGNLADGDGCSASCGIENGCGDGVIDKGEACDDGNLEDGDGCSSTCGQEGDCGNGKLEAGEACDDGNTVQYDGCEADCTESPDEVVCAELPPLSEGRCAVKAGDARRLIQGDVMTPHTVLVGGQVLIDEQGSIVCADCVCEGAAGATEINCPGAAVSPGLINSHDHITFSQNRPYTDTGERYEHRHDWRKGKNGHTKISAGGGASKDDIRWAELRFIIGGATSTIGSGSATGFLRNLDTDNQEGLSEKPVDYETFPLGDSGGTQLSSGCGYPDIATQASIANQDAYFPHIAEGIDAFARNEFECVSGYASDGEDLLEPQSAFIHAVGLNPQDYARMAADGTTLVWSPRSNVTLYGDTAQVTVAHRLGVRIVLGTDWIPTGSMNMLRELRCAADLNRDYYGGYFDDRDLWRMTTVLAAAASATDDVIGTLRGGMIADVAIFDGANATSAHAAVVAADPGDVVLVLRGGEVLYGDAVVVDALASGCDALDVCGQAQRVCSSNDLGVSLAELEASAQPDYPLFFCDTPMDEPSCVPSRPSGVNGSSVYTGAASAGDQDGDGIADAEDNCPGVFNPVRPLDDGQQGDFDGDGEGDPCDVCPLDADVTDCVPYDSTDADGDGIANDADNCPNIANADQADSDMDEKGELCDPCPEAANPGNLACVTTIYAIKKGEVSGPVALDNALVTACVNGGGFFLQVKPGDADYVGPENSGVFVYHPDTSCGANLAIGDRVSLNPATASNFFGQIQLNGATVTVETSAGETLPPLVELTTTQAGGEQANAYEGVLVEVKDAMVTDPNPMAGPGDQDPTGEFLVDGVLRVDNLMYEVSPAPTLNAVFKRIA